MITTRMYQNLLLTFIGILLLANVAWVFIFVSGVKNSRDYHHERKAAIAEFLQKEIGFDEDQLKRYDSLSTEHEEKTKDITDEIKTNKLLQFKLLGIEGFSDTAINNVVKQISEKHKLIEFQMLQHIKDIRNLCTSAQRPVFDSLFYKILIHKAGN